MENTNKNGLIQLKQNKVVLDLTLIDQPTPPSFDCLLLLNSSCQSWIYELFIPKALNIIATDGGANFLYHSPYKNASNLCAIIGDLDSLDNETKLFYKQKNVHIIEDSNQDTNDFQKGIMYAKQMNFVTLVSLGVLGGRIDQQLCNLSAIQKYSKLYGQRFVALGNSSLMFLLKEDEQAIIIPGKHCILNQSGLFCFGRSKVRTKGFKWQLNSQGAQLEWSKLVSSSNLIVSSQLQIKTQKQIFFTISLSKHQKNISNQTY